MKTLSKIIFLTFAFILAVNTLSWGQNDSPRLYHEASLTAGEVLYGNLQYKMGGERFYTLYQFGISSYEKELVYGLGLGLGTRFSLADQHYLATQVSVNSILGPEREGELNLLNKLDLNYQYQLGERLSLFMGPSLNFYVSQTQVGEDDGTLNVPYSLLSEAPLDRERALWIGANLGLSFRL
jgi:hypothetical protein